MTLKSQSDFAAMIGVSPSQISQLKAAGRLVMQGRMVDAEASLQLIADTEDPGKIGVKARHAAERLQKQDAITATPTEPAPAPYSGEEITGKAGSVYQQARAMKESYAAKQAKIAYEREVGLLLDAQEVRLAVADGDAIIRNRLEALPDLLAPQLAAETNEQKIRAMLIDQIEYLLTELSSSFHKMTRPHEQQQ